ncbi:MAG: hypothetical protein EBW52_09150, partial [Betaproteobacteria bacterium]|nr:hypothetical protein [Betaproteobacteria bacterium]
QCFIVTIEKLGHRRHTVKHFLHQHLAASKSLRLRRSIACGLLGIVLSGCHVRTPEFHCRVPDQSSDNMEIAMSPVELRFENRRFGFVEERGNQRLYRDRENGEILVFDLSSMDLIAYESPRDRLALESNAPSTAQQIALGFQIVTKPLKRWRCERYKML